MTTTRTRKRGPVRVAPITVKSIAKNGSVWDAATTAYLKEAMRARGIPIPKTKPVMIERIKAWAVDNKVPVSFTIG